MPRLLPAKKIPPASRALSLGRESFRAKSWSAAFLHLSAADQQSPLPPEELGQLAQAANLIGKDSECAEFLTRAHRGFLAQNETRPAAQSAFWLGFMALLRGDLAQASGWLARSERLLANHELCPEKGYLAVACGLRCVHQRELQKAYKSFTQALKLGERFRDYDLIALGRNGQGRVLIRQGRISRGLPLLDEAMVAVRAGDVSPLVAGGVYCSVIDACSEIFDLRRAHEWTAALEEWCASQPDIVPFRGHCLVRRSEILQLHGSWQHALDEAHKACQRFASSRPRPEIGAAFYRLAEIHRLRGDFTEAEAAYEQAAKSQRLSQPGLAQLRLAQGRIDSAASAIRRIAEEVREPGSRARVLDAYVDIMLAAEDMAAARSALNELKEISEQINVPYLYAVTTRAAGAVLLAEKEPRKALLALRKSWKLWTELNAPYDAARTRALIAHACRDLGDHEAFQLELNAARETFQQLGASPDLARIEAARQPMALPSSDPLTDREQEVLKLVASGATNKKIAARLYISEKTVARHISNIFTKLDLTSRAAATAYAFKNSLA